MKVRRTIPPTPETVREARTLVEVTRRVEPTATGKRVWWELIP